MEFEDLVVKILLSPQENLCKSPKVICRIPRNFVISQKNFYGGLMMRTLTGAAAVVVLMMSGAGVALADTTNSGPITENSHHHEFTNCGGTSLINVANCVDLLDL